VSLVDETIHYVEGKLEVEERDIDINKIFMEDEVYMSGDAEKMKQTFINILMNGCQAMNGEGYLTVEIQKNSKYVNVSITDTGKGIHPDDISTIFDPFVTTREMGVGLGLAISKRVIEDHHGKISVKSKLAKGTTFTVSLPVQN
jgi:signal transduction histidine kinase